MTTRKKISVAAGVAWIAANERKSCAAILAKRSTVKMLAALAGAAPIEIAEAAVVARDGRRSVTDQRGQDAAMAFIERYAESNGGSVPTYQEITDALRYSGPSVAYRVVAKLADSGRVRLPREQKKRGIQIIRGDAADHSLRKSTDETKAEGVK